MSVTEDGITDLMADYLRNHGVNTRTQISISTPGTRDQPDFQVNNGGTYVGEAKWESKKWQGFAEARDYGNLTGVNGSFLITYPEELKDEAAQSRLTEDAAETVLSGHEFSCAFMREGEDTDIETLEIHEIPDWIRSNIEREKTPEADPDQVVSVLRQAAYELNEELETAPDEDLFRNVLGATPAEEEEQQAARETAGFLLVNQIAFYRVLSSHREFPDIDPDTLGSPSQLGEYFDLVLDYDYTPVYSFRIAETLPQESLSVLQEAVKSIYALNPERINHDILGKVFHELIPVSARKQVAAYYTKNGAADILAGLAIDDGDDYVMDPACGSGTLLASSYMRKRELTQPFSEDDHRRFVEEEITGIDVMPFAAHLSCIHLALQAPIYETDEVNIGIEDSTKLSPGDTISPLSFVLPEGSQQRGLGEFASGDGPDVDEEAVEGGSIAMDAVSGEEMELRTMDVVIMNPPFTRQESVAGFADGYKDRLRSRFNRRDNRGHIHGKMSYCSYFLFLADKFLDEGGRIAAVLPASVLNKSSDSGIREMLLNEYSLEYIMAREDRPNFSEDTDLREVMIIARKGEPEEDGSVTCIAFEGLDVDADGVRDASTRLTDMEMGETLTVTGNRGNEASVWRVPHEELDTHNLFSTFSVQERRLIRRWYDITTHDEKLTQVGELSPDLTRGGSSHPWTNGVLAAPDTHTRKSDPWVVKDDGDPLLVEHRHINEEVEIPRSAVEPYFLRKPYRTRVDVSDIPEYTVVRSFDGIDRFLELAEEDEIPGNWEDHVTENASHMAIPETIKLTAPGTRHMVYYSDDARIWHRMWMHTEFSKEDARIHTLWFDSTIGLLQFLLSRIPVEGAWTKFRRYSQSGFYTIDCGELSESEETQLQNAWDAWSDVECPHIIRQLVQLVDADDIPPEARDVLAEYYDVEEYFGTGFDERRELDETILDVLGVETDGLLDQMYTEILLEFVELVEMGR